MDSMAVESMESEAMVIDFEDLDFIQAEDYTDDDSFGESEEYNIELETFDSF